MKVRIASLILLLLIACPAAQDYYADIDVVIDAVGASTIKGLSNHPLLSERDTYEFTSKKGEYWLFNLSLENSSFSDYVYSITLPEGSQVNYVKTDAGFRITSAGDRIRISGAGDGRMEIVIQYSIEHTKDVYDAYLVAAAAVILLLAAGAFFLKKDEKKLPEEAEGFSEVLTERQKDILKIIADSDKPVNQTRICEVLDLPKSSVSRNINSLERLGLVEKTKVGISTFISLKR